MKFKRAVTVADLSYIEYLGHIRSRTKERQHQVLETVGSGDPQPCTSSRGMEEKRKKRRKKIMSRKKAL